MCLLYSNIFMKSYFKISNWEKCTDGEKYAVKQKCCVIINKSIKYNYPIINIR